MYMEMTHPNKIGASASEFRSQIIDDFAKCGFKPA